MHEEALETAMPEPIKSRLLDDYFEAQHADLSPEDVIHALVPMMRQVAQLHHQGKVASLGLHDIAIADNGRLILRDGQGTEPKDNLSVIERLQPKSGSALKVVGEFRLTVEEGGEQQVDDLRAPKTESGPITKPIYLTGLRSWEIELGHHDELTDIFQIGLILVSLACDLDPGDADDVELFSRHRNNLFGLNPRLHPVLATLIVEMTALNRHERARDLEDLTRRLETYRDQPIQLDVERLLAGVTEVAGRRNRVLAHLRDRLFDLSRRNRLIHFRATQASVNMTQASMPIVMNLESVRPDQLCTWRGAFPEDVLSSKPLPLTRWLRFEDQPQLPSSLDKIIADTRRDRAENGFNQLRLVVAFLHWHNLKEAPNERIISPLLWLPAELSKLKGVRDQYMMRCPDPIAEFNPALRHSLRQLYNIQLPEFVNLKTTTLEQIHADLLHQIQLSEPGIRLELQDRPQIRLIHQKAVQRVNRFNRRYSRGKKPSETRPDFSYDRNDYRPLGLALFEKFVQPSALPQRNAVGTVNKPVVSNMAAQAENLTYVAGVDEGHRFSWQIDLTEITLANLNYRKMSLVRDFNELIERSEPLPGFDSIFSIEPRPMVQEKPPSIPLSQKWNVVAADATQEAAIAQARTGRSFIIQGPPGTGKSQTITNLIADYAARGKRVLFVCEKRAALDVVFHRLKQARLDGLSCIIHDSQEDKKEFILDLKQHYEAWGGSQDQLEARRAARARTLTAFQTHAETISAYSTAVAGVHEQMPQNLRMIVRRAAALPDAAHVPNRLRETLPTLAQWDANRALAFQTTRVLSEAGHGASFAEHPFSRLNKTILSGPTPYASLENTIDTLEDLLSRLDTWLYSGGLITPDTAIPEAIAVVNTADQLLTTNLGHYPDLLNARSSATRALTQQLNEVKQLQAKSIEAQTFASSWLLNAPSPEETKAALAVARANENSFFRFLYADWRRLSAEMDRRYNLKSLSNAPRLTSILELLDKHYNAKAMADARRADLQQSLNTPDLEAFALLRQRLLDERPTPIARLIEAYTQAPDPLDVLDGYAAQARVLNRLSETLEQAFDLSDVSFEQLSALLRDLRENLDDLPAAVPHLVAVLDADKYFSESFRAIAAPLPQLEALVVDEAIVRFERANPEVKRFDIDRLIAHARKADKAYENLHRENADMVRAVLHRQFLDHVRISELSATALDSSGKALKKRYGTGRRELEHEFNKTMRYRSIREISGGSSGAVVNDLKPIWLMSPLSVSDTLPLQDDLFDVVIFDEASQIPVEDAVPALCRAGQVIVVGDEMQLPPTSFFATSRDDEDLQITAEEDGQKISILLDADSLLAQSARNLPAMMLAWHYRSRFESLISFSNAAFYKGQLVTIPDRRLHIEPISSNPLVSNRSDDAKAAAARLLAAPITTHRIADGVYEDRVNKPEARFIARMLCELLALNTGMSLGIVAFSEAQQSEIEDALESLAAEDTSFATALEAEYTREDEGQFNGLFVKNLENVQGDERDIILMSLCYAPGRDGKMAMNFGPINQRGGEKRLNVIFSRARRHMSIVSTIAPEQITNIHNDGARALRSFLTFAEAQSRGSYEHAQSVLSNLNPESAKTYTIQVPPDPVRSAIRAALEARGHQVHDYVGGASFRCDLAIVDPAGDHYALAILLDRSQDIGDNEERFLFRPRLLRAFGWRVIDVPVAFWLRNRDQTIMRIETELRRSSWDLIDDNPYSDHSQPSLDSSGRTSPSIDANQTSQSLEEPMAASGTNPKPDQSVSASSASAALASTIAMDEYQFVEGSAAKFWRIGVSGKDLVIEFGRLGTKGQRLVKSFDTPARTEHEANKLKQEKTGKGYRKLT